MAETPPPSNPGGAPEQRSMEQIAGQHQKMAAPDLSAALKFDAPDAVRKQDRAAAPEARRALESFLAKDTTPVRVAQAQELLKTVSELPADKTALLREVMAFTYGSSLLQRSAIVEGRGNMEGLDKKTGSPPGAFDTFNLEEMPPEQQPAPQADTAPAAEAPPQSEPPATPSSSGQ